MRHPVSAVAVLLALVAACGPSEEGYRIAVATFSHETCTFCPVPTGIEAWEYYGPPVTGDTVLGASGYIRGFAEAAREYRGTELVGIRSPRGARRSACARSGRLFSA